MLEKNFKKDIIISICLALVSLLLLLSPVRNNQTNLNSCPNVITYKSIHFPVDCDSPLFLIYADNLNALINHSIYQTRPLYIISANILGSPLAGLYNMGLFEHIIAETRIKNLLYSKHDSGIEARAFIYYPAYIFLNFVILILALLIFKNIVYPNSSWPWWFVLLSLILVINPVTKTYLWSAHAQIFNIFMPLFLVIVSSRFYQTEQPSYNKLGSCLEDFSS